MGEEVQYAKLAALFAGQAGVVAGQMFGKSCLKVFGKAFIAQHRDTVVFKLAGSHHRRALAVHGAVLWDPSGKGRPMKAWVALPLDAHGMFEAFAHAALGDATA